MTGRTTRQRTDAEAMLADYERLRRHVVVGRVSGVRHGLAVLLQKGMAGWMEVCSCCRAIAERTSLPSSSCGDRLPAEDSAELVDLLANMALNHLTEEKRV